MNYQTTAVIRQRGQLTIPEEVRKIFGWLGKDKVVTIQTSINAVVVKPYSQTNFGSTQWKRAHELVQISHSFVGGKGNISSQISQDREGGHYD
ncbi:MAG: AbrB/MazE/SpoVT family DNA-binding domain-containing protein [Patescibacteria group bacterium]